MPPRNLKFAKPKNTKKTIKRLLTYLSKYKIALAVVFLCIAISSLVSIANTYFVSMLIDDYIAPNIGKWGEVAKKLLLAVSIMAIFYVSSIVATYAYNRIMVHISTRTLNKIRDDMFSHMQTLPIKYFDTHTHGELMSRYTNDVDTLSKVEGNYRPKLLLTYQRR